MASESIMPMYGGRCVRVLKMGTKTKPEIPIKNMVLLESSFFSPATSGPRFRVAVMSPRKGFMRAARKVGTSMQITEGRIRFLIRPMVLTLSLIQSIVVVTSPIGDQAPPALADKTAIERNHMRSLRRGTIRRRSETMTSMEAKLSSVADRKKAIMLTIQSSFALSRVL